MNVHKMLYQLQERNKGTGWDQIPTYLLTYLLTYSMEQSPKLTGSQLVKKVPAFYGN